MRETWLSGMFPPVVPSLSDVMRRLQPESFCIGSYGVKQRHKIMGVKYGVSDGMSYSRGNESTVIAHKPGARCHFRAQWRAPRVMNGFTWKNIAVMLHKHLKLPATGLFVQQWQHQWQHQNSALLALCLGTTGYRWIPLTKGQWCKKRFHDVIMANIGLPPYFDGLVQDCGNSTANILELLQSQPPIFNEMKGGPTHSVWCLPDPVGSSWPVRSGLLTTPVGWPAGESVGVANVRVRLIGGVFRIS